MLKLLLLVGLCITLISNVFSQKTISGTVRDAANGLSLPGVNVTVKEKAGLGTTTNNDGKFTLKLPAGGKTLIFSFIGYIPQKVPVGQESVLQISLKASAQNLEELVVTGLGMQRGRSTLGYAISSIKSDEIKVGGISANPLAGLYGKAAGVGIQTSSAGPTGGINIKIRGAASLESSSKTRPLFVVDGVPIYDKATSMSSRGYDPLNSFDYGSGINDVNPEDIESLEILKGAKASVLYGSEGANGVVLITTKKGTATRGMGVTASFQYSVEEPVSYINFQNEYGTGDNEYYELIDKDSGKRKLGTLRYSFGPKFDGKPIMDINGNMIPYSAQPNNFMGLFRTGNSKNTNVAIAGANDRGSMRLSITNYNYNGIMDNFFQKKNTVSFTGKMNVSDFATLEVNTNLYDVSTNNRYPNIQSLVSFGLNRDQPFSTLRNLYKTSTGERYNIDNISPYASNTMNILWHQKENSNRDDKFHIISSAKLNLRFHKNIFLILQGGIDYTMTKYTRKAKQTKKEPMAGGQYRVEQIVDRTENFDAILNFDKNFFNDRLNILAFAGASYRTNTSENIYASTFGNFLYPDWYSIENEGGWPNSNEKDKVRGLSRGDDILYSAYGGITFGLDSRYYIELTARNDWSSTLPSKNNSYFYPGISFNWNFHEQLNIPQLNFGKIRVAWADVGRPASRYYANNIFELGVIPGTNAITVSPPGSLFSGDLKPERKQEIEVGTNLRFFPQNRLEVDFSFYNNNIYNQIMGIPLSPTSSYPEIRINAGNVRNWGAELFIKGALLAAKDYRWELTFTVAKQNSKVVKLYPGINQKTIAGGQGFKVVANTGKRMGELLTYDYLKNDKGERIISDKGLYQLDNEKGFIPNSNVNPDFIGGFSSSFFYKNLNITVGLDYKFGGTMLSFSNYYLMGNGVVKESLPFRDEARGGISYYINNMNKNVKTTAATAPSDSKDGKIYHDGMILPGVKADGSKNDIIIPASAYYATFIHDMGGAMQPDHIFKNNYIKFREIGASYTIPKKWVEKVKLQKVQVSAAARNLFYIYKTMPNVDAESSLGENTYMEYSFIPSIRSYVFGITVSF